MQKFSNTSSSHGIDDEEIEEDIKYEGKFEHANDLPEEDNDEFVESISRIDIS
jgi:hypothetical protein